MYISQPTMRTVHAHQCRGQLCYMRPPRNACVPGGCASMLASTQYSDGSQRSLVQLRSQEGLAAGRNCSVDRSAPVKTVCQASADGHGAGSTRLDGPVGVMLSGAVMECLQSTNETLPEYHGSTAEPAKLLLACVNHPSSSGLRTRMNEHQMRHEEVAAVLQIGLEMQQKAISASRAKDTAKCHESTSQPSIDCYSSLVKDILHAAMHVTVSQGSDVVQVKDLLYCLTDNRDVVCVTNSPLYYAFCQMYGPLQADKVMDSWIDILSAWDAPKDNKQHLPPHITAHDFEDVLSICTAQEFMLQDLLAAFKHRAWVPSTSVSLTIWGYLFYDYEELNRSGYGSYYLADYISEQLTMIPIHPRCDEKAIQQALGRILHHRKWTSDASSSLVAQAIATCFVRLDAVFAHARDESNTGPAYDKLYHALSLISSAKETVEAYTAIKTAHRLACGRRGNGADTIWMLQPCDSNTAVSVPVVTAARLSQEARSPCWPSKDSRLGQQLPELLSLVPSAEMQRVKQALPAQSWLCLLGMVYRPEQSIMLHLTARMIEELNSRWGYVWNVGGRCYWPDETSSALAVRLAVRQSIKTDEQPYFTDAYMQWLWDDILEELPTIQNKEALTACWSWQFNLGYQQGIQLNHSVRHCSKH